MEAPLLQGGGKGGEVAENGDYKAVEGLAEAAKVFWLETVKLWKIAGPLVFLTLCSFALNSVTTIFVGHLGELELSGVSISLSVIGTFSFGFLILGTEPLPSLHSAYSRLVQEEEVRTVTQRRADDTPNMAFAVRGGHSNKQRRTPLWCTFCSKPGHLEDRCWEKHGYPEGRGPRQGKKAPDATGQGCSSTIGPSSDNRVNAVFGPYLEDDDWSG